jgi:hypothetical protein
MRNNREENAGETDMEMRDMGKLRVFTSSGAFLAVLLLGPNSEINWVESYKNRLEKRQRHLRHYANNEQKIPGEIHMGLALWPDDS